VLAVVLLVALAAIMGCGGGSDEPGESAHINNESGSTHDLVLDERTGTQPAAGAKTTTKLKDLRKAANKADCYLLIGTKPDQGKQIPPSAPAPEYETEPLASGPYVEPPYQQADGAYMNMPDAIDQAGALNNGRMTIQYAPDLSEEFQLELKGLYDTMYGATLLFPNDEMEYAVAATTWTNLLGCPGWAGQKTLDAIRDFGKVTWGKYGGAPVKSFPFEGPTPADPEEAESSK
jgi:hypothetical protein